MLDVQEFSKPKRATKAQILKRSSIMYKSTFVNRLSTNDPNSIRKSKISLITRADTAHSMRVSNSVNKYQKEPLTNSQKIIEDIESLQSSKLIGTD